MDFTLISDNGDTETTFGGDASFSFSDGVLTITSEGTRRIYSPHAWTRIEHPVDPNENRVYVM
jgi:hypothetical protein